MNKNQLIYTLGFVLVLGVVIGSIALMYFTFPMVSLDGNYDDTDVFIEEDDNSYFISNVSSLENDSLLGEVSFKGNAGYKSSLSIDLNYYVVNYDGNVVESGSDKIVFEENGVKKWNTVVSNSTNVETILFSYSVNRNRLCFALSLLIPVFLSYFLLTIYIVYVPRYLFSEKN